MKRQQIFLTVASIALFSALSHSTSAQKLPAVQQVSIRAPANVKIDGKATEWGQMKAYNKPTELNYTVANDDKKLYLVVQTDVSNVYNRISNGGLKFVIQKNSSKKDEGAPFVKFPFFTNWKEGSFGFNRRPKTIKTV